MQSIFPSQKNPTDFTLEVFKEKVDVVLQEMF